MNEIKFNNEAIKNAIMDALDKMEKGIKVDRNELINVLLKYGDRNFGIKNKDTRKYYTEEELQYSVYIHIINENNKCYIGQTSINPKDRWGSDGSGYKGQVFYNPIKYYGWDNISHIVICNELTQKEANEMEVALISIFKSNNREEFGYNVANGGNSVGQHSEETRKKMSEARKGKAKSEETKVKMREAKKGENHPRARRVFCNKMIFTTVTECSEYYNVNRRTMNFWLQGKRKTPSEFIELGLRFATQEDIRTYPRYIEEEQNQQNKQN